MIRLARAAGRGFGALAHLAARRGPTLANLERALWRLDPAEHRRIAHRSFQRRGEAAADAKVRPRLGLVKLCRRLTLEGWDHLLAADALGRGVLVLATPLGLGEMALGPPALYGERFRRLETGNDLGPEPGERLGVVLAPRPQGGDAIGDDDLQEAPLFGLVTRVSALPARVSLATGAPVVPVFAYPEPRGVYRIAVHPAIEPPAGSAAGDPKAVRDLLGRYLAVLEDKIRRRPELWPWMEPMWIEWVG